MGASPKASESKLFDIHQRVQELELTKDTADQRVIKVDEAWKAVVRRKEHVQYIEDWDAGQFSQLFGIDAESAIESERLSKPEVQVKGLSADLQNART